MLTALRRAMRRPAAGEAGFTLMELSVAMVVFGVLAAITVGGWAKYQQAHEQRGVATQLLEAMRNAQSRAQAESINYCVGISTSAKTWTVYKNACVTGALVRTGKVPSRVTLVSPAFKQFDGSTAANVVFTPRGVATAGTVKVGRTGSSKQYTVDVEGLTSRVSIEGLR